MVVRQTTQADLKSLRRQCHFAFNLYVDLAEAVYELAMKAGEKRLAAPERARLELLLNEESSARTEFLKTLEQILKTMWVGFLLIEPVINSGVILVEEAVG